MEFRPCIDIHNGKIKQIVGGSLRDEGNQAEENFVSEQDGSFFADFYSSHGLRGGHIILLNKEGSEFYEASRKQAFSALSAYPGGLQIGGGVTAENAEEYLRAGASHVIVTSYVFREGRVDYERLEKLVRAVGKEHLVLDLSCRKKVSGDGQKEEYYIVTDRWQKFTEIVLQEKTLAEFSNFCAEFLIHAVDVEGKAGGIEESVASLLGKHSQIPTTYAGGVHSFADLAKLKELGNNRVNVTIGSALDLFGGAMNFEEVLQFCLITPNKNDQP